MQMANVNNTAFTLLEILLSAIIFIVTVAGVFATLGAVRQPMLQKDRSLSATLLADQTLEGLYNEVDEHNIVSGTWKGALSLGQHSFSGTDNQRITDSGTYTVTCADGSANDCDSQGSTVGRKVVLTINY